MSMAPPTYGKIYAQTLTKLIYIKPVYTENYYV